MFWFGSRKYFAKQTTFLNGSSLYYGTLFGVYSN